MGKLDTASETFGPTSLTERVSAIPRRSSAVRSALFIGSRMFNGTSTGELEDETKLLLLKYERNDRHSLMSGPANG